MNAAGAILMGNSPMVAIDYARKSGGLVIPFYTPNFNAYDDTTFRSMQTNVERYPEFRGIGEVLARHGSRNINRAADDPFIVRLLALAASRNLMVNLHHEPSRAPDGVAGGLAEMDRLLAANPDTVVVWAHAAATGPGNIRPLLRRHPNLHIDLSNRFTGTGNLNDEAGVLLSSWRTIFEELPERFLFGSDLVPESPGNSSEGPNLSEIGAVYDLERRRLAQLTPASAEKIGALNLKRLLKLT